MSLIIPPSLAPGRSYAYGRRGSRLKMTAAFAAGMVITGLAVKWPERAPVVGNSTPAHSAVASTPISSPATGDAKATTPAQTSAGSRSKAAPAPLNSKSAPIRMIPLHRDVAALPPEADASPSATKPEADGKAHPALAADEPLSEREAELAAKAVAERENAASAGQAEHKTSDVSNPGLQVSPRDAKATASTAAPDAAPSSRKLAEAKDAKEATKKRPAKRARIAKHRSHPATRVARTQAPEQVDGYTPTVRILPNGRPLTIYHRNDDSRMLAYGEDRAPRRGFFPFFGADY